MANNIMEKEYIQQFNSFVINKIREHGTCKIADQDQTPVRIAVFEADSYRADDSIDGFVGWWNDDHSQMTYAETPWKVFENMP